MCNSKEFVDLLHKEMYELRLANKDHEIAVLKKALELCWKEYFELNNLVNDWSASINSFIEQAEKELKGEKDE